ncbi:MAG: hypothetical protein ABR968_04760 [Bacteroidales bacterium]
MKKLLIILITYSCVHPVSAQFNQSYHEQINFAKYLLKNNMPEDCISLLQNEMNIKNCSTEQKDTVFNLLGHAYFDNKAYDSSAYYFSNVSLSDRGEGESKFLSAYSYTLIQDYSKGIERIKLVDTADVKTKELRNFELSGIYLLSRDTSAFSKQSKSFSYSYNDMNEQEKNIVKLDNDYKNLKHNSGALAGMMSAVVPGLGKVYAGKTGQGLSSFLPVTLMGLMTWEAYKKAGPSSARFILTAGLFSVFYIGNIWGSVLSVSVSRSEKNNEINNQILLNLRIPLQKFIGIYR